MSKLTTVLFLFFLIGSSNISSSQSISTSGTEFWLGFMQNYASGSDLIVNVSSQYNISGTISIPNIGYIQSFNVNADETVTLNIPSNLAIHTTSNTIEAKGIFIQTTGVATVYAINKRGESSDACLILDSRTLGTDYLLTSVEGVFDSYGGGLLSSEFLIIATEDNTEIEIIPTTNTSGGNGANIPIIINIDKGESYQVKSSNYGDLTGTIVRGTINSGDCRPFAVFSGNRCAFIPDNCQYCDHLFEQSIPIKKWGNEYLISPFLGISKYQLKILANENNTNLNINGNVVATLNAGQAYYGSYNNSSALSISSNLDINVTQYMIGNDCSGGNVGDPTMSNVFDVNHLIKYSVFKTFQDSDFEVHGISIISPTSSINQIFLDGILIDSNQFTLFPGNSNFSHAEIEITDGTHYLNAPNGVQGKIYGYGEGTHNSYTYNLGGQSLNEILHSDDFNNHYNICYSDSTIIGDDSIMLTDLWWELGEGTNDTIINSSYFLTVLPDSNATYIIHGYSTQSNCQLSNYYHFTPSATGELDIIVDADTLCLNRDYQLTAQVTPIGDYNYNWLNSAGLSNDTIHNPVVNCTTNSQFQLIVTDLNGCIIAVDSTNLIFNNSNFSKIHFNINPNTLCEGDTSSVQVLIEEKLFTENFNSGFSNPLFELIQGVNITNGCGIFPNNIVSFNGAGTRILQTTSFDFTNVKSVMFNLMSASNTGQCDPTEFNDHMVFEYTINGGATWQLLALYDENLYHQQTNLILELPQSAKTTITKLRWRQTNNDGLNTDIWYLDDLIFTTLVDNGFTIDWTPNSEIISLNQGRNLKTFNTTNSTFHLSYLEPNTECHYTDSIEIIVVPNYDINITPNFTTCTYGEKQVEVSTNSIDTVSISWSPSDLFSNPTSENPMISVINDTTVYVTIISSSGCEKKDSISIEVNGQNSHFINLIGDNNICNGDTINIQTHFSLESCIKVSHDTTVNFSTTIGTTTSSSAATNVSPFTIAKSNKRQFIIKSSELLGAGLNGITSINSIGFIVTAIGGNSNTYKNFTIRVGCVSNDDFSSSSTYLPNLETVLFSDSITMQIGDNILIFDNDYRWDGISNLVFEICYENQILPGNCAIRYTNSIQSTMYSSGNSPVCGLNTGGGGNFRPTIILGFNPINTNFPTSYLWTPNNNISNFNVYAPEFYPDTTTTYHLIMNDTINNCIYEDSITIIVTNNTNYLNINEGEYLTVCQGEDLTLTLNTNSTNVLWTNVLDSNSFNIALSLQNNETYSVTGTMDSICYVSDSIQISVISEVPISFPNDTISICTGDTANVIIGANNFNSFTWSNGANTENTNFSENGWLTLMASNNCWSDIDSVFIKIDSLNINLGEDTALCIGNTLTINSELNQNTIINWSTNETTQSINVNSAGVFWIEAINNTGCFSTDTIEIFVNPLPILTTINIDTLCSNDSSLVLIGVPAGGYYSGVGVEFNEFNPEYGSQILQYHYTDLNGCTDSISQLVPVIQSPVINAGTNETICFGDSITLNAQGGLNYTWNNNVVNGQGFVPLTSDLYVVFGENEYGCESSDQVYITVSSLPTPIIHFNNVNSSLVINPLPDYQSYLWINCDDNTTFGDSNIYYPMVNGNYAVIVANAFNCLDTSECLYIGSLSSVNLISDIVSVYPNPSNGIINFDLNVDYVEVSLYDFNDKLVIEKTNIYKHDVLDISSFSQGIYTLKIISNSKNYSLKIIKL